MINPTSPGAERQTWRPAWLGRSPRRGHAFGPLLSGRTVRGDSGYSGATIGRRVWASRQATAGEAAATAAMNRREAVIRKGRRRARVVDDATDMTTRRWVSTAGIPDSLIQLGSSVTAPDNDATSSSAGHSRSMSPSRPAPAGLTTSPTRTGQDCLPSTSVQQTLQILRLQVAPKARLKI